MNDRAVSIAQPADRPRLLEVWETAVRATHDFLPDAEIDRLRPLVAGLLAEFMPLYVLRDPAGVPVAFLGVTEGAIEMLFVHADHRGEGAGRQLAEFAIDTLGARRVDVNEQNTQGIGFYRRLGFLPVARSPLDAQGQPYPILHLLRDDAAARPRRRRTA